MYDTIAIAIAKSKMDELNVENYILRHRHIRLDGSEERILDAQNEWFIIITQTSFVTVKSKVGIYDLQDTALREIQHLHTGKITLNNSYHQSTTVVFLQLIPKMDTKTKIV